MAEQAVPGDSPASPETEIPAAPGAAFPADAGAVPHAGSGVGTPADPGAGSPARPRARLDDIIAWQEEIFAARQPESRRLASRAGLALAGGVTSSWQSTRPQPV